MKIDYSTYYWQTDRIRLRPATNEDWSAFYENYFDTPARFLLDSLVELPLNKEDAKMVWEGFIENSKKEGRINFTIESLEGIMIGSMSIAGIDERNGNFGIGMQINRDQRGKGYGTEAMKLLLNYAFNERRLHKYQSYVMEGNIGSETMLKKLGCVKEGVHRKTTFHDGRYWDEIHYGLLAEEFNAKHRKN